MTYVPASTRYDDMQYRRSGRSGLHLPAISLGMWQNFGHDRPLDNQRAVIRRAFDLGVTHFDLANNYGPPYGSAEENFGRILATDLRGHRVSWSSALIGAASVGQLEENIAALHDLEFSATELDEIDSHATESGLNLWARSSAT